MSDYHRSLAFETLISRRDALKRTTLGAIALATGGCLSGTDPNADAGTGRLAARVTDPTGSTAPGIHPLGLESGRDGLLYVPANYNADTPAPLALLLHGASGDASELVTPMRPLADTTGLVLVAVDSRGLTWDAVGGSFSYDVAFIDRALTSVFSRVRIDPARVRIIGFSDGATYSLSLGLINGDLFSRVVAFSPGFVVSRTPTGKPKIFITHGTADTVLPIDQTSRIIVPALRNAGYDVEYHEFDGGHAVPADLLPQAVTWASAS
jgi:predicted esterase